MVSMSPGSEVNECRGLTKSELALEHQRQHENTTSSVGVALACSFYFRLNWICCVWLPQKLHDLHVCCQHERFGLKLLSEGIIMLWQLL